MRLLPARPALRRAHRRPTALLTTAGLVLAGLTLATPPAEAANVSDGAPVPPGGVALTWSPAYMTDSHAFSAAEAQRMATTYDLVAAMPTAFASHAAAMRRTNPRLSLLAYANATLAAPGDTTGLPETAFAHTTAGARITAPGFGTYLMESSSPAWRTAANAQCDDRARRGGYDGCLVDMLTLGIFSQGFVTGLPVDPATRATYTQPAYRDQMTSLAAYYRARSPQLAHVGNSVENSYRYWQSKEAVSRPLATSQPGTQMEDFLRGASNPADRFPSAADWLRNVDVVRDLSASGTIGLFTTKLWSTATDAQVAQWQSYAMATFLMGANGRSYFSFTRSRNRAGVLGTNVPYAMPDDLGAPRAAMVQRGDGAWTRAFARGLSVVNPTTATVTVQLAAPARTLAGRTVSAVTLPPHSGEVLVTGSSTTPVADTAAPVVGVTSATGTGGTLRIAGSLTDDRANRAVVVAVRDEATGTWRRPDGSWGAYAELSTSLSPTSTTTATWSRSLPLTTGRRYGVSVVGLDAAGNRSVTKPWRVVTVS